MWKAIRSSLLVFLFAAAYVNALPAKAETRYVSADNPFAATPYTSWATAAANIQDAIDRAMDGDEILVTNGVYNTGVQWAGGASNRVAVTLPVTLRSVNGPEVTSIAGYQTPAAIHGIDAVRCVYLTNGAIIIGFTLTNGATSGSGGGVWCESASAAVSNCVVTGNSALQYGGGAYSGTLKNCTLADNSARQSGGGSYFSVLESCNLTNNVASNYGGGAYDGTVTNCVLIGNSSGSRGGGAYNASLNNCELTRNTSGTGGGTYFGVLKSCRLINNSAGSSGGGAYNATLSDCVLTGNYAVAQGGGAAGSKLTNCRVMGNRVLGHGGGVYQGSLTNCLLVANVAGAGGGASGATLFNCTLTGNSAIGTPSGGAYSGIPVGIGGGGSSGGTLNNCIIYFNTGASILDQNCDGGTINYSCTTPLPLGGTANRTDDPQLASAFRLSASSPLRGAGIADYSSGVDLDGEPWAIPPSIGCDEYRSESATGNLNVEIVVSYTNVAVGFAVEFQALIDGRLSASRWDFGDGTVVSNRPFLSHAWQTAGDYLVELQAYNEDYPAGAMASAFIHVAPQEVHYVALNGNVPVPPYTSWSTAATNIQDAIDLATQVGSLVLVSNGVYQIAAGVVYGMSNRVAITNPIMVRSVNGPATTSILGYQVPGATNGPAAVRCAFVSSGATLAGFTLAQGATMQKFLGNEATNASGGGVWCESATAIISNCVLVGNSADWAGGAAFRGTLVNCTLASNSAPSGGGACFSALNNCTLKGNWASMGGGSYYARLNNCTQTGNKAQSVGGAYGGSLNNCINYYNTGGNSYFPQTLLNYCCTTPLPSTGVGNFATPPEFLNTNGWSNLRLQSNSLCINAGNTDWVTGSVDQDGRSRVVGGIVDVGAYEFQPDVPGLFLEFLRHYNLPTDGSADEVDSDNDGHGNSLEWLAGTVPIDSNSVLRLESPVLNPSGVELRWSSVTNRSYWLERSSTLNNVSDFSVLVSNLAGLNGVTSFTDTNPTGAALYRVRAQP
jgi:hypothetical protein